MAHGWQDKDAEPVIQSFFVTFSVPTHTGVFSGPSHSGEVSPVCLGSVPESDSDTGQLDPLNTQAESPYHDDVCSLIRL